MSGLYRDVLAPDGGFGELIKCATEIGALFDGGRREQSGEAVPMWDMSKNKTHHSVRWAMLHPPHPVPLKFVPDAAVITRKALKFIEREGWNAGGEGTDWLAILFNAEGRFLTLGRGQTVNEAAAAAWVWNWHPCDEGPWDGVMREFKPDDYRFELFAPGTWDNWTWDHL